MSVAPIRPREPLGAVHSPREDAQAREIGAMVVDAMNALSARVNAIDEDVLETRLEVFRIGRELAPRKDSALPVRDKESSFHDFDPELEAIREGMREKVNSRHHPISESGALALIRAERKRLDMMTELGTWHAIKRFFATGLGKAVDMAV